MDSGCILVPPPLKERQVFRPFSQCIGYKCYNEQGGGEEKSDPKESAIRRSYRWHNFAFSNQEPADRNDVAYRAAHKYLGRRVVTKRNSQPCLQSKVTSKGTIVRQCFALDPEHNQNE